jgi:hypothetical protein
MLQASATSTDDGWFIEPGLPIQLANVDETDSSATIARSTHGRTVPHRTATRRHN